ncbi:hypothetical protein [Psychroserpens sp. SPM9]|uniref:hypothetical protein n=1 Tax=Psychroserpens sp. SPM9 TaxID=2975598 RepID=UPI0021A469E9|nr:hypothetical protein [Psychroserpens sp. SPM9]MDG5493084.1 hypothetical protein [Psychroserpens sp. SPM9]
MNTRWYISTLIIILTLLGGIASEQQMSVPNQELVLQFSSTQVSTQETQQAITLVKQQLQAAGVENIQVQKQKSGQLKITYYSDADVERIKELLSKQGQLALGYVTQDHNRSELPSEEKSVVYNLDIYEIQQGDELSGLQGKLALESKAENDRLINPNVFVAIEAIDIRGLDRIVKVAYKFHKNSAIAIDNRSRIIPEVRAGPTTIGMANLSILA